MSRVVLIMHLYEYTIFKSDPGRHEGSCFTVMSQRHVAGTKDLCSTH